MQLQLLVKHGCTVVNIKQRLLLACNSGEYSGRPPLPGTAALTPLPRPRPRPCSCRRGASLCTAAVITGIAARGALVLRPSLLANGFASALNFVADVGVLSPTDTVDVFFGLSPDSASRTPSVQR